MFPLSTMSFDSHLLRRCISLHAVVFSTLQTTLEIWEIPPSSCSGRTRHTTFVLMKRDADIRNNVRAPFLCRQTTMFAVIGDHSLMSCPPFFLKKKRNDIMRSDRWTSVSLPEVCFR